MCLIDAVYHGRIFLVPNLPLRSSKDWSLIDVSRTVRDLHTDAHKGLREGDVSDHRERFGENILVQPEGPNLFSRLFRQFRSPLVLILFIGGSVSAFLREYVDASVIGFAIVVNLVVSIAQEKRADRAFALLKSSETKTATVVRGGTKRFIPASEVVVGDLLVLESGMRVSADARVIEAQGLAVNESSLTGEWAEVAKVSQTLSTVTPLPEQNNMLFAGTQIVGGIGKAIVVRVGEHTAWGTLAKSLGGEDAPTPLEVRVARLSRAIAFLVLVTIIVLVNVGIVRGGNIEEIILVSIALAIAVVPEGLPAAVTVVLAVGMEAILRRGGLVRNILSAEILGSTTTILADKTGTMTKGDMRVSSLVTLRSLQMRLDGKSGEIDSPGERIHDEQDTLQMAMLASDAFVEHEGEALKDWVVRGRPVERAIVLAGLERGLHPKELFHDFPRVDFLPFSSAHRFVASLHRVKGSEAHFVYFSGAPEELLRHSTHIHDHGVRVLKHKHEEELFLREAEHASREGLRLIGIAYIPGSFKQFSPDARKDPSILLSKGLTFAGYITLHDPVRDDVPVAIHTAREAGVRVMMVTGDMPDTARAIAKVAGIIDEKTTHPVYTGNDLRGLTDNELYSHLKTTRVFARMLPEDKLRVARVLQSHGEIVAMTGDGINDAPTLRGADIGIAVGSGTEVAKESADLVLIENGMGVIVSAIEEGRRMFDNLRKIVVYLLSTSFGDITLIGGSMLLGLQLPLLPAQIIWTNIVTEGLMNFAYAFEPKEGDVMARDPRSHTFRDILTPRLYGFLMFVGLMLGASLLGVYQYLKQVYPIEDVRTMMFLLSSLSSLVAALCLRTLHGSALGREAFSNRPFWLAFGISVFLLLIAFVIEPLRVLLHLSPLSGALPWEYLIYAAFWIVCLVEGAKYLILSRRK